MSAPGTANGRWLPSVSVVIATRDRPQLLRQALDAIAAQDYEGDVESIVVFDQSEPDRTLERAKGRRRVRVLANSHAPGLAGGRNTGAGAATGELLAFCDDDDAWMPPKLDAQVALLAANPDAAVATCGVQVEYDGKAIARSSGLTEITFDDLLASRVMEAHPSTVVVRRDAFAEIGPVDEALPGSYAEDYEWLLRAARRTRIVTVARPLVRVLWHRTSFFSQRWEMIASALTHLLEKYPEFERSPKGLARVTGQIAFASAASGRRDQAWRWARRTLSADPRQPRAYLALAVAAGLPASAVVRFLNSRGKGI